MHRMQSDGWPYSNSVEAVWQRSHNITHSGVMHHKEDVRLCFSSGCNRNKMPSCGKIPCIDPS